MCGIYARFKKSDECISSNVSDYELSVNNGNESNLGGTLANHTSLTNRGPDDCKIIKTDDYELAFYRLAIVGMQHGMQPFIFDHVTLLCNGEIYNYQDLHESYGVPNETGSDCEIIAHLYKLIGIERTIDEIDGEFAFILIDNDSKIVYFSRDYMGIKPLYYSFYTYEKTYYLELSSEIKGMNNMVSAQHCLPRHIYSYDMKAGIMSYQQYTMLKYLPTHKDNNMLFNNFVYAVERRITQSERPVGFFLSGGLDSSLVLSVALEYYHKQKLNRVKVTTPQVFTFGFDKNAPDVLSAKSFVNWARDKYGNDCMEWHLVIQDISEGLHAIPAVIHALETYDTTTIRASTPMYLLSHYIAKNTNVKVLLSGEGSDELFGGYLYFKYAPNDVSFRSEILTLMNNLYLYDVLRADRSTASNGLEIRPPFLDKTFVNSVLQHEHLSKGQITTKELLRNIFKGKDMLPENILLGKKEAFSDAVGLSWKDSITLYAKAFMEKNKDIVYETSYHITPVTDEMKMYQMIFYHIFGNNFSLLPALWLPNQSWVNTGIEPSARVLTIYNQPS